MGSVGMGRRGQHDGKKGTAWACVLGVVPAGPGDRMEVGAQARDEDLGVWVCAGARSAQRDVEEPGLAVVFRCVRACRPV